MTTAVLSSTDFPYACLKDMERTLTFRRAIRQVVRPGHVVVDAGAGTGILSFFAAAAGAATVYAVEIDALLVSSLRLSVALNGLEDRIVVVSGDALAVDLPRDVDVFIGELIETGLIDETQVAVMNRLRERGVIGHGTRLIPDRYQTSVELVEVDATFYGFAIAAPMHEWPNYVRGEEGWLATLTRPLTQPAMVVDVDLCRPVEPSVDRCLELIGIADGIANGVRISGATQLTPGLILGQTNALNGDKILLLPEPATVRTGERIACRVSFVMGGGLGTFAWRREGSAVAPIPRFPEFRRLEIGDRPAIEAITRRFPPYSDFGFTSLWCWDTDESCALSMLGGNLVVRLKDYATDAHFLSFLGQDAVVETVGTLLAYAREEDLPTQLRLVPEVVIAADERLARLFSVTADADNFDYLYAVDDWARFSKPAFREHRRMLARCRERAALDFRILDPGDSACQDAIVALFDRWTQQKPTLPGEDRRHERTALQRAFALTGDHRLAARGSYDGECLVGFSIWEGLPDGGQTVFHFQKADRHYRGLSSWQAHEMGRLLFARGYRLINFEQDLGISGLRAYKRSLGPCRFLRKYVIAERGGPER